jgi:hypothetical protein
VGLDVYAGTLTRYLTGNWELATETAAREMGLELQVERLNEPDDAVTDPEEVRAAVLEWREALANALELPLAWPEDDDVPYFTDKPDWSGYGALLLFAAHQEHPEIPLPQELPKEPFDHPLFKAVTGGGKRGLLRRRKEPEHAPRYASLYGTELWLPVATEAVWTAPFLNGEEVTMGSTEALLADLRDVARRLGASAEDLEEWRRSGGVGEVVGTVEIDGKTFEQMTPGSVDDLARFALGVFTELAEQAVDHRLPMKLDY